MFRRITIFPLPLLLLCVAVCSCNPTSKPTTDTPQFVHTAMVRYAPVRALGANVALSWLYAMTATIESEHIMRGDSVHLSVDYAARCYIARCAERAFFSPEAEAAQSDLHGTPGMLPALYYECGALPHDAYFNARPHAPYAVLLRSALRLAHTATSMSELQHRLTALLDEQVGVLPGIVAMGGMMYSPRQFAHSVCAPDEYVSLTAVSYHDPGSVFALEIPQNKWHQPFQNLSPDTLLSVVEDALYRGHPVCWQGDTTEVGWDPAAGIAVLCEGQRYSPTARRQDLEQGRTTADLSLVLVGMARSTDGGKYFVALAAGGSTAARGGLMYLSEDYMRMKTVAVTLTREAWSGAGYR